MTSAVHTGTMVRSLPINSKSLSVGKASDELSGQLAQQDLAHCRRALDCGSKSFLAASHLLPAQMRNAATALYAFCREADDLVDLGDDQTQALCIVRMRVDKIFSDDELSHPADRALRCVVRHYELPKTLLDALIEGFAWDASGRQYQTLADVEDYAARVAGTVGAMMAVLMGARDPSVVARACDLGVAMQLTNICRDVGEDARAGRCYLPIEWLAEAGVEPADTLEPHSVYGVQQVIRRMLERAAELYRRADSGIAMLPADCQRGIRMARHLYAAIGDEILRSEINIYERAYVPAHRKVKLLAKQWYAKSPYQDKLLHRGSLPATAWLVAAVKEATPPEPVQVYSGLVQQPPTTSDELINVLRIIDRLDHVNKSELQVGSGKVPLGYAGAQRL